MRTSGNAQISQAYSIKDFFMFFKKISIIAKPKFPLFLIAGMFTIIASLSQAVSLGLVIPLLNSLINDSQFSIILGIPILGNILKSIPFTGSNIGIFFIIISFITIAIYLENIAVYISTILIDNISVGITHTLRTKVFERFLGFTKPFYDKRNIGELNVLLNDESIIGSCEWFIIWLNQIVITLAFASVFLIMMLIISWKLTLAVLIFLIPTYYFSRWISRKIQLSAAEGLKEKLKLSSRSLDVLSNMPLVKLYATEERELEAFTSRSQELKRHMFNAREKIDITPRAVEIINSTAIILIACIAVFLFLFKDYSLAKFMVYFLILKRLASHINIFSQQWSTLMRFPPNIKKILWVFDDSDKPAIKNGHIHFDCLKNEISFKDVRFSYNAEIPVIKGVSFSVKKGKILAIVGPTGAGKTTLINFLPRFYEYGAGEIEIDGIELREFEARSLRKKIGVVTQDAMLMNDTIKNNITYGLEKEELDGARLESAVRDAQIYDFIMGLPEKYDTIVGDRGIRLSGGEKQRVSIARAILKNPEIIILDEATSSLDSYTEKLIQEAINHAIKGKTVFVIAHRLSTIKNSDWIIVLENGQVSEQGTLDELMNKKGRLYYYWELQKMFF